MKQKLKNYLKIGILLLIISTFLTNCETENLTAIETSQTNEIQSAKSWFENYPELNNYSLFEFTQKIDWTLAKVFEQNNQIVIEIPLFIKQNFSLISGKSIIPLQSVNRLIFIKNNKSELSSLIINISSSNKNSKLLNNIDVINYFNMPIDFSGEILIFKSNTSTANLNTIIDGKQKIKQDDVYARAPAICYEIIELYDVGPPRHTGIYYCLGNGGSGESSYPHSGGAGSGSNSNNSSNDDQIDASELTDKAKCAYEKLLSSGISNFHNMITDLFIEFGDGNIGGRDLTFKMSTDLPDNVGGRTEYYGNGEYGILINSNFTNTSSSIEIAAILVHEIAHAFLGKHFNDSNSSFSDLYKKYINETGLKNYSHDIMKDHFINRMAIALKNYDSSIFQSFEDYKILASQGVYKLTKDQEDDLLAAKLISRNNDTNCD